MKAILKSLNMNIKDLPQGSYKVISSPQPTAQTSKTLNIKNLPAGSYKTVQDNPSNNGFPTQEPPTVKSGFTQALSGFLGIQKLGQGLATAGRVATGQVNQTGNDEGAAVQQWNAIMSRYAPGTPERKRAVEQFHKTYEAGIPTQAQIDPGTQLSNREVIGSAANVGLNVLTPGAFKGGLASQAIKSAVLGAGYGLAGGLNDNKSGKDLIAPTATGAAIGAAIPVAGKALGRLKSFITEKLPERLYNTAVKPTLDELRKNTKFESDTLGKQLLKEGVHGSPKKLLTIADKAMTENENKLQTILKNSPETISRDELGKYLQSVTEKTKNTPGIAADVSKIEQVLAEFPDQIPLSEANVIKRNIYQEINSVGYKLDANLTTKKEAMKALASGIKQEIEKKTGNAGVAEINQKLSIYGRLQDRIVDQLARANRNNMLGLGDTILAGGSLATHSPLGFFGILLKHLASGDAAKTGAAVGLNKLKNVGEGKVGQAIKQITKRALLNTR